MKLQFTPRAIRSIHVAGNIAAEMGDSHIAVGHILAALARDPHGAAGMLLNKYGLTDKVICDELQVKPVIDFQI